MLRGNHLEPIQGDCFVFRLVRVPLDLNDTQAEDTQVVSPISINPMEFRLTSLDQKADPPHLSVWHENLTTPDEAYQFLKEDSPCKGVAWLGISEVRKATSCVNGLSMSNLLDVIWVYIDKQLPGYEGHAGITGLDKAHRRELRSILADIANSNAKDPSRVHCISD